MVHASNHCSASNSLSGHIHRTLIITLITIVPVRWRCQEDSPQSCVGRAGHWIHASWRVPIIVLLKASQSPQPLLPRLPGSWWKTAAIPHPLLRSILGLWDLWLKADLAYILSLSLSPLPASQSGSHHPGSGMQHGATPWWRGLATAAPGLPAPRVHCR